MDLVAFNSAVAIVPQPPPPGLYITLGPDTLSGWALQTLTKTVAFPARIIWVDAANAFNAYLVAISARAALKDPASTLRSFLVARPFTAYQLETMVSEKTLPVTRRTQALLTVIAEPLKLFSEAEGRDTQIRQCYDRFLVGLKTLARETAVLVLSSATQHDQKLLSSATRITRLQFLNNKPVLSLV